MQSDQHKGSFKSLDPQTFTLNVGELNWSAIEQLLSSGVSQRGLKLTLEADKDVQKRMENASQLVRAIVQQNRQTYGINTGFGLLATESIPQADIELLQRKLVLSHAAGVGQPMPLDVVRLMMVLKLNSLAQGYSGVRSDVVEQIVHCINEQVYPKIPEKGSVGASGDLAPLAHFSLMLIGEGEAWHQNHWKPTNEVLKSVNIQPLSLAAKEGLALLNGTQASTAYALKGLYLAESLLKHGLLMGAMSVEAVKGSRVPFDSRIHRVRNQPTQEKVAAVMRALLPSSEIQSSHETCGKVQDPYSLRCQPQVMGACLFQIQQAKILLMQEANGVTDNPLIFMDEGANEGGEALSGGNFHAEPVAMAADNIALALAEIGALSERRIALLMDHHLSGLPPFLVKKGGLNSGFMIAQVTAAALASENKQLATPSSVDSLPTSANQEDHVSMATYAGRRLLTMADNTMAILAIEWLAAAQGCDFHKPLRPSKPIEKAISLLRKQVPFYEEDRYFAPDIEAATSLIREQSLLTELMGTFDALSLDVF